MKQFRPSKELLQRYLESKCSEEERIMVDRWYHHLTVQEDDGATDEQKLFDNILNSTKPKPFFGIKFTPLRTGIAASLILLISLCIRIWLRKDEPKTHTQVVSATKIDDTVRFENQTSQFLLYTLPDSSTVQMLPGAEITYPKKFHDKKRLITFSGEGFFSIKRNENAPFIIETGKITTEVLGTSFNLRSGPTHLFKIRVATGKVSVTLRKGNSDERILLSENQEASVEKKENRLIVTSSSQGFPEKELWEPISLTYQDAPLRDILRELQSRFNIKIELLKPEMGECAVTVELKNHNLPDILSMLNLILGITYEMQNDTIQIRGSLCEESKMNNS